MLYYVFWDLNLFLVHRIYGNTFSLFGTVEHAYKLFPEFCLTPGIVTILLLLFCHAKVS